MTRERAKELLPVIKAWVDGQMIQAKSPGEGWLDVGVEYDDEISAKDTVEYRIKPEPREFWLRSGIVFYSRESAETYPHKYPSPVIHVREVLE